MSPRRGPVGAALFSLTFYVISGLAIAIYNKWLLTPNRRGFSYPTTLILAHMISNFVLAGLSLYCCFYQQVKDSEDWLSSITFKTFCKKFIPLGLLLCADVTLTNVSFEYTSVAMTEIVKAGIPLILMFHNFRTGRDRPSVRKITAILLISLGIVFTLLNEMLFVWRGFLAAAGACIAGAFRLIQTESILQADTQDKLHPCLGLFYFAPISALALIPITYFSEYDSLSQSVFVASENILDTVGLVLFSAILSFVLNLSSFFLIQTTSALTLTVVAVCKFSILVVITSVIFEDKLALINKVGLFMAICGIALYNYIKYNDEKEKRPEYTQINIEDFPSELDDKVNSDLNSTSKGDDDPNDFVDTDLVDDTSSSNPAQTLIPNSQSSGGTPGSPIRKKYPDENNFHHIPNLPTSFASISSSLTSLTSTFYQKFSSKMNLYNKNKNKNKNTPKRQISQFHFDDRSLDQEIPLDKLGNSDDDGDDDDELGEIDSDMEIYENKEEKRPLFKNSKTIDSSGNKTLSPQKTRRHTDHNDEDSNSPTVNLFEEFSTSLAQQDNVQLTPVDAVQISS